MAFNLEKFFGDVFKPAKGEVVTVMYDLPHGSIADHTAWKERRAMAEEWRATLEKLSGRFGITVNPSVTYEATGGNNADLPATCRIGGKETKLEDVLTRSTIVVAMPQFSATAPLFGYTRKSKTLRVGSMPGVAKFMEESGLSADYAAIAEKAKIVAAIFNRATGAEVEFSTGHKCFFDFVPGRHAHTDDGILHPERAGTDAGLSNLPAGEVYVVPNEAPESKTAGELPMMLSGKLAVCTVKANRIVEVKGEGPEVEALRGKFKADAAWQNIAEFAVGLNDKARVTGIVLEDEKAGFHWAYGRSDHLGGTVGVANFTSPTNVVHQDIVYAKESPIVCKRCDLILQDGTRKTVVADGVVKV
jgi:hypothetical protein